jgi:hypothetical protein
MIHYTLLCEHDHEFDGWFGSSDGFDEQAARGDIACPQCGSTVVRRGLMAPNVAGTKKSKALADAPDVKQVVNMMAAFRKHVEANFENVGDKFADVARAIHYEEEEPRAIYGEATLEEAASLVDEGVEVAPLPGVSRKQTN